MGLIVASVLIIDDDMAVRELLRQILEDDGHEVFEASDGLEGVRAFQKRPTDLIFTDMLMPEKDGVEVIMELRDIAPSARIVAISGGGRGLDAHFNLRVAEDFGALVTLAKPFTRGEVLDAVQTLLDTP
uniref:Response regulator receiver protein n=1 Tax=Magnetococcus massalia (strain MO-1) TaxID=451514 RepID=A0A1S7LQ54_MAGMO|nr:response regulator [Candidatus Magnetococcus massalia]CRH08252.1 Response regulator receiver protein [Candidatus Magnetococcus massalia]CRH08319.1 Response regulator receiver protein [Candidatus Magnetococcus massalia]